MHLVVFCIATHIWVDHEPLVLVEVILGSKLGAFGNMLPYIAYFH